MEQYLRKNRFGSWLDGVGLRMLLMLLAVLWFVYLWGLSLPSIFAGIALGIIGQVLLSRYRQSTVVRREAALRQRLGGELMLEDMMLAPARQAHFQAALLLGQQYPLTMRRVTDEGVLCESGEELLLISCLRLPRDSELSSGDLAACQRACIQHGAVRGVLCPLGKVSPKTLARAEQGRVLIRVVRREVLQALAGQCSPATDEQLVALGQRKKRHPASAGGLMEGLLRRDKAARYMLYGVALLVMYVLSGSPLYPVPGTICLTLGVLSLCTRKTGERL